MTNKQINNCIKKNRLIKDYEYSQKLLRLLIFLLHILLRKVLRQTKKRSGEKQHEFFAEA